MFQPKTELRIESFVAAMRAMLFASEQGWDVRSLTGDMSFASWHRTVQTITRLRYRLEDPSRRKTTPGLLAHLVSEAASETVSVELRAQNGLEVEGRLVSELVRSAVAGYGEISITGRNGDSDGVTRVWLSALGGESVFTEVSTDGHR